MGEQETAFIAAYDAHADALFRFAYFSVRDHEMAKDLVADTFTKVWQYIAKGNIVENIRALCYRTLRNLIVDHWRKHKSLSLDALSDQGFEPIGEDGHQTVMESEESLLLKKAIGELPLAIREVILLRYIEGYDPKEIAELLDISPSLVSVRIFRGTALLKKIIRT